MRSCVVIILDGVGVGALPDADKYGDIGADTLGNTAEKLNGLNLPNLQKLGLGNIHRIKGVPALETPVASWGKMAELSKGKDSIAGHWELMGVVTETAFPTYPDGFPQELISKFTEQTGFEIIGNKAASGTKIIEELGDEHVETGKLIVYTSADSVFQIAAHVDIVPLEELYRVCQVTRDFLNHPHKMSRVIARPFMGKSGAYQRTPDRKDYSLSPPDNLILNRMLENDVDVIAIGKISDLYSGKGIAKKIVSKSNAQGMEILSGLYTEESQKQRLILLNLVDFDMLWGHRNNPEGMGRDLEAFDSWLGKFLEELSDGDLLLLSADHGNDPTSSSSDHSREYVPLLAKIGGVDYGADLGVRKSFADFGKTIAEYFDIIEDCPGTSFLSESRGKR